MNASSSGRSLEREGNGVGTGLAGNNSDIFTVYVRWEPVCYGKSDGWSIGTKDLTLKEFCRGVTVMIANHPLHGEPVSGQY